MLAELIGKHLVLTQRLLRYDLNTREPQIHAGPNGAIPSLSSPGKPNRAYRYGGIFTLISHFPEHLLQTK